jgi:hypothetical protein
LIVLATILINDAPHVPGVIVTLPAPGVVFGVVHPAGTVNVTTALPALFAARNTNAKLFELPATTVRDAGVTVNALETGAAVIADVSCSPRNSFTDSNALRPLALAPPTAVKLKTIVNIITAATAMWRSGDLE